MFSSISICLERKSKRNFTGQTTNTLKVVVSKLYQHSSLETNQKHVILFEPISNFLFNFFIRGNLFLSILTRQIIEHKYFAAQSYSLRLLKKKLTLNRRKCYGGMRSQSELNYNCCYPFLDFMDFKNNGFFFFCKVTPPTS